MLVGLNHHQIHIYVCSNSCDECMCNSCCIVELVWFCVAMLLEHKEHCLSDINQFIISNSFEHEELIGENELKKRESKA